MTSNTTRLTQSYLVDISNQQPEKITDAIYIQFISPLTAYIGQPLNFIEILTTFQNISNAQVELEEIILFDDNKIQRQTFLNKYLNQLNPTGRQQKPRKEILLQSKVDGHILKYLSTICMHPIHQTVRKGILFSSDLGKFKIYRELIPKSFITESSGTADYTGSQHPANAPQNNFGHDYVVNILIGKLQQEILCYIPDQFDSQSQLFIDICVQGEQSDDYSALELNISKLEYVIGSMENIKYQ